MAMFFDLRRVMLMTDFDDRAVPDGPGGSAASVTIIGLRRRDPASGGPSGYAAAREACAKPALRA
jgi:hypothetical protein